MLLASEIPNRLAMYEISLCGALFVFIYLFIYLFNQFFQAFKC